MIRKSMKIGESSKKEERPVAVLVQMANQFNSKIYIESENKHINAKSIMGMMALDLDNGQALTVYADGTDESEALDGIERFLKGEKKI